MAIVFLLALDAFELIYFFAGDFLKLFVEDAPGKINQPSLS